MWLARYSDRRSDDLDYLTLLSHFKVRSIKSRFIQYDIMFLFHIHRGKLDNDVLVGAFGLAVPEGCCSLDKHYSLELCFSIEKQTEVVHHSGPDLGLASRITAPCSLSKRPDRF